MTKKKFRRRKWLIDAEVQVGIAVRLCLILVTYLLIFSIVPLIGPITMLFSVDPSNMEYGAARAEIGLFVGNILPSLLFALACMVMHGVLLLHRLAGPVYRAKIGFQDIGKRDLSRRMYLRRSDFLKQIETHYNKSISVIGGDIVKARESVAEIRDAAGDDSEEAGARVLEHVERLEKLLGAYRLENEEPAAAEEPAATVEAPAETSEVTS